MSEALVKRFIWLVPGMLVGGENRHHEKQRLRKGVVVLVATPGRLLDHLSLTESFVVSHLQWLILDEADRLLDMGFQQTLSKIVELLDQRSAMSDTSRFSSSPLGTSLARCVRSVEVCIAEYSGLPRIHLRETAGELRLCALGAISCVQSRLKTWCELLATGSMTSLRHRNCAPCPCWPCSCKAKAFSTKVVRHVTMIKGCARSGNPDLSLVQSHTVALACADVPQLGIGGCRQSVLVSATLHSKLGTVAEELLSDPVAVGLQLQRDASGNMALLDTGPAVDAFQLPKSLQQLYMDVPVKLRLPVLFGVFHAPPLHRQCARLLPQL